MPHQLEIEYCTQCRWMLRAAWMAQEMLTTFEQALERVSLVPGKSGIFEVRLNQQVIFSRKEIGRFPESKELKQLIRDVVDPSRDLGHSDRKDATVEQSHTILVDARQFGEKDKEQ